MVNLTGGGFMNGAEEIYRYLHYNQRWTRPKTMNLNSCKVGGGLDLGLNFVAQAYLLLQESSIDSDPDEKLWKTLKITKFFH